MVPLFSMILIYELIDVSERKGVKQVGPDIVKGADVKYRIKFDGKDTSIKSSTTNTEGKYSESISTLLN